MNITTCIAGAAGLVIGVAAGVVLCEKDILRIRHLEAGADRLRKAIKPAKKETPAEANPPVTLEAAAQPTNQ